MTKQTRVFRDLSSLGSLNLPATASAPVAPVEAKRQPRILDDLTQSDFETTGFINGAVFDEPTEEDATELPATITLSIPESEADDPEMDHDINNPENDYASAWEDHNHYDPNDDADPDNADDEIPDDETVIHGIMQNTGVDYATAAGMFEDGVEAVHNNASEAELDDEADEAAFAEIQAEEIGARLDETIREREDAAARQRTYPSLRAALSAEDPSMFDQYVNGLITEGEARAMLPPNVVVTNVGVVAQNTLDVLDTIDPDFANSFNDATEVSPVNLETFDQMERDADIKAKIEAALEGSTVDALDPEAREDDEGMDANMANMTRTQALAEIRRFYALTNMPKLDVLWNQMDDNQLFDLLHTLRSNNGGSVAMAEVIRTVTQRYQNFLRTPEFVDQMRLVNQKASDQFRVLQSLERMAGRDFTVNQTTFQDYHAMLKNAVAFISSVSNSAYALADKLHLTVPADEMMPNGPRIPIVEGMPSDPRIVMYILEVFYTQLDKLAIHRESCEAVMRTDAQRIQRLEDSVKQTKSALDDANRRVAATDATWAARLSGEAEFYIRDMSRGGYLRKKNPDAPLASLSKDLDLRGSPTNRWTTTRRTSAFELRRRLQIKYPNRDFRVFRVSVVEEQE